MSSEVDASLLEDGRHHLRANCEKCFGLCCVALCFSASDGFPIDKEAGQPCIHLQSGFRCKIHESLRGRGLKGCTTFDCFGAGQKVSQVSFAGLDWQKSPDNKGKMFKVFTIMMQLHELLWYLAEALTLKPAYLIHDQIKYMFEEIERLTSLSPDSLLELGMEEHKASVDVLLLKTSELVRAATRRSQKNHTGQKRQSGLKKKIGPGADLIGEDLRKINLRGANLRGAYLIAADLRGASLRGTDFIGADFRDADLRGADLSDSIFVTQSQVNAAKGDRSTKLPSSLDRPEHWNNTNYLDFL
ncbi:pentapeptide repeat-containing protein [Bacillus sp. RC252]|uniref:pentapeptide repeat-containing protein n=1 Tax=Bacillus sp. RC252 TaxID=3156289 RepID=UPI00384DB995